MLAFDYARYRVPPGGGFRLASIDPADAQGVEAAAAKQQFKANRERLAELQERLYAEGKQALLVILQAMDTAGKDSTIRKVMSGVNPQGCRVWSFKKPSAEEQAKDFLWRVHDHVPPRGHIALFNRSHYEDVLIVRVHGLAPPMLIQNRYGHINDFEELLHEHHTRVVKIMLHISKDYQLERLRRRLRRPDKHWKFNPDDLRERARWDDYMKAYEIALNRCSTAQAPWYVVPAEHRWFRDLVVSQLLVDTLDAMNPQYPPPAFDPAQYPPESIE
ncbi:MAG: polyphosphate kinase 2 family protein [Rhodothermales bacterium]|nr:polyphosphate kinase 2 family protein [Rhodothermales bacterium]